MCHIDHKKRAACVRDLTELLKINGSRISGSSRDDHLRLAFHRDLHHLVIINESFVIDTIRNDMEISSGEVDRTSVCQMSAVV